jgi:hypothetical protein
LCPQKEREYGKEGGGGIKKEGSDREKNGSFLVVVRCSKVVERISAHTQKDVEAKIIRACYDFVSEKKVRLFRSFEC